MKPKRIFEVYCERAAVAEIQTTDLSSAARSYSAGLPAKWRWRLIATRNGQIVGGSQEAFDSRGNALRAARREAGFYQPSVAAVEVAS